MLVRLRTKLILHITSEEKRNRDKELADARGER
jgi:hypothetical protein